MDASELARRTDLDPRASPATYQMKWDDGVFLEYPLFYVGYRNPDATEKLLLGTAFLGQTVGFFNLWAFELLMAPQPEDRFVQGGVTWVVRQATGKLFYTRYRCLCTQAQM